MAYGKPIKIQGIPDFVIIKKAPGNTLLTNANVYLQGNGTILPTAKEIALAILKLDKLGFKYTGVNYDFGFGDIVEDHRMEFVKQKNSLKEKL